MRLKTRRALLGLGLGFEARVSRRRLEAEGRSEGGDLRMEAMRPVSCWRDVAAAVEAASGGGCGGRRWRARRWEHFMVGGDGGREWRRR